MWFFERAYAGQAILKVAKSSQIVVANVCVVLMPVRVKIEYSDGTADTLREPTAICNVGYE